jgi:hypothetical protein
VAPAWSKSPPNYSATAATTLAMEAAVNRLSLEPAVSSVTWTTSEPEPALLPASEE